MNLAAISETHSTGTTAHTFRSYFGSVGSSNRHYKPQSDWCAIMPQVTGLSHEERAARKFANANKDITQGKIVRVIGGIRKHPLQINAFEHLAVSLGMLSVSKDPTLGAAPAAVGGGGFSTTYAVQET